MSTGKPHPNDFPSRSYAAACRFAQPGMNIGMEPNSRVKREYQALFNRNWANFMHLRNWPCYEKVLLVRDVPMLKSEGHTHLFSGP